MIEDILAFSGSQFGEATRGSWELFYDGLVDQLGDGTGEGVAALWFQPAGEEFVFSAGAPLDMFSVRTGDGTDLFRCQPFLSDRKRRCPPIVFLSSSGKGLVGEVVDAFSVGDSGVLGDIGDGDGTEAGPPEDEECVEVAVFLPSVSR